MLPDIKYKDFSECIDEYRMCNNKPKMWIVRKVLLYIFVWLIVGLLFVMFVEANDRSNRNAAINKKYKKVVKVNWLGFKSTEYHERD
jgi:hypothetical protein